MEDFRKQIDECDKIITEALIKRFKIVKEIGKYKKEHNLPIVDKSREQKVYEKIEKISNNKIKFNILKNIYSAIIQSAVELEEE